jgi:hypothetical protein
MYICAYFLIRAIYSVGGIFILFLPGIFHLWEFTLGYIQRACKQRYALGIVCNKPYPSLYEDSWIQLKILVQHKEFSIYTATCARCSKIPRKVMLLLIGLSFLYYTWLTNIVIYRKDCRYHYDASSGVSQFCQQYFK